MPLPFCLLKKKGPLAFGSLSWGVILMFCLQDAFIIGEAEDAAIWAGQLKCLMLVPSTESHVLELLVLTEKSSQSPDHGVSTRTILVPEVE